MQERIEQSCREDDETLVNDNIFAELSESQMSFSLKKDTMIESYKIIKEISRGNMGIVYLANDMNLNRLCAIKIILSHDFNTYTILLKRFKKEAELCAELNHPKLLKSIQ